MKKRSIALIFFIILIVVAMLLTGGLAVDQGVHFSTKEVFSISSFSSIETSAWIGASVKEINVPFVLLHRKFTNPYRLYLRLTDRDSKLDAIEITTVNVEYASGETVMFELGWKRQFEIHSYDMAVDEGLVRLEDWQASGNVFDDIEIKLEDARLTIGGVFTTKDGRFIPLKILMHVKTENAWRITTAWKVYASC